MRTNELLAIIDSDTDHVRRDLMNDLRSQIEQLLVARLADHHDLDIKCHLQDNSFDFVINANDDDGYHAATAIIEDILNTLEI